MARHLDPELASALGTFGIRTRLATLDKAGRQNMTAPARAARLERLRDEIDPDRVMDPADLDDLVAARIRRDMAELALRSVRARRAKKLDRLAAELDAAGGAA